MVLSAGPGLTMATPNTTPGLHPTPGGGVGSGSLRVYVRCRPLLPQEEDDDPTSALSLLPQSNQVCVDDGSGRVFQYAGVFGPGVGQAEVFAEAVDPLMARVRLGGSCAILAYGQTGSGKTHTMGTYPAARQDDEGILQRAIRSLISPGGGEGEGGETHLSIAIMELYNDTLYDLLTPTRQELMSRPTRGGGLEVVGCVEEEVCSVEEGVAVLERGFNARSTTSTSMNQHSSRSHALIHVTHTCRGRKGWLHLVDLAGSECVGRVAENSATFSEGISINKALLTLGKVLAALTVPTPGYVPYRESLLTRLLKDSIGGAGQTVMVACVTPARACLPQTLTTLRYAQQATYVKSRPLLPPSTVKKSGVKRGRSVDVTATPGAWKRRNRGGDEQQQLNATISTPGHHPPPRHRTYTISSLNVTIDTPPRKLSEVKTMARVAGHRGQHYAMPPPPAPIFEDNSPSSLSCISTIHEAEPSMVPISPIVERVRSHLEQTVLSHLEGVEERLEDAIIARFTTSNPKTKPASKRHLSKSSTPTNEENRENATEATGQRGPSPRWSRRISAREGRRREDSNPDSSEDDLLTTTLRTLLGGRKMKKVLRNVVTEILDADAPTGRTRGSGGGRGRILADITNTGGTQMDKTQGLVQSSPSLTASHTRDMAVRKSMLACDGPSLPITSTAVCEGRAVRRSTRLSTQLSYHTALVRNLLEEDPTASFISHGNASAILNNEPSPASTLSPPYPDTTVIFHYDGSPELRPAEMQKLSNKMEGGNKMGGDATRVAEAGKEIKQELNDGSKIQVNGSLTDKMGVGNNVLTTDMTSRMKRKNPSNASTDMDATVEFHDSTTNTIQKPPPGQKVQPAPPVNPSTAVSLTANDPSITLNDTLFSQTARSTTARRQPQRVCAHEATLRNRLLLQKESRRAGRRRPSIANTSRMMGQQAVDGESERRRVLSPSLQEKHTQSVLRLLNEGDKRALQKLPTVGPKTAFVIMQYRKFCGPLASVAVLRGMPGLSKNFCSRFMQANMLDL